MALLDPLDPVSSFIQGTGSPSRVRERSRTDYQLHEKDDEFVLTIEMPGFNKENISVRWDEGKLHVSAENTDEELGQKKTYYKTFKMPKHIDSEEIKAQYKNGVLEIKLPITSTQIKGKEIPVKT